jgi:adenylyltransferase/sulfurtransferase
VALESIAPAELRQRLEAGEDLVLLDVREPDELALCRIEGSLWIPMGELSRRHGELDPERSIVCICHHGVRSARVAGALAQLGFARVLNLSGGIDRWAEEVDPAMSRY